MSDMALFAFLVIGAAIFIARFWVGHSAAKEEERDHG